MSDFPPGQWSPLLVGHQWPSAGSLAILTAAATNRSKTAQAFEMYGDALRTTRAGLLADQEGVTADDTRDAFQAGEYQARDSAGKNASKAHGYQSAHAWISELRSELTDIAARGNSAIEEIQASKEPVAIKVGKIVDVVVQAQSEASGKAGSHSANL